MSRVHVWAAALLAVAVLGFTPGARGEPCLEVTGATNAVGDDHTCALWAKGKYLLQDDEEVENGRPVWHREESHVHQWGVVVSFPVLPATVEDCRRLSKIVLHPWLSRHTSLNRWLLGPRAPRTSASCTNQGTGTLE